MNKRTKSFLLSILTLSFIFYSCSNLANDLQKRKNQNLFNITIQNSPNGTVTVERTSGIKAGEEVILTVTAISGYELKSISVVNALNKDIAIGSVEKGGAYKFTMPNSDVTVTSVFTIQTVVEDLTGYQTNPEDSGILYKIEHYLQDATNLKTYELAAIQTKAGEAGEETSAEPKVFSGFNVLPFNQKTIIENGSTVVKIFYNRKTVTYTYDPNGGNWDGDTKTKIISGLYVTVIQKPNNPQKTGYDFSRWDDTAVIFDLENKTIKSIWTARTDTLYKVIIYEQNAEGKYSTIEEYTKTGTTDSITNITADPPRTGYTLEINQVNIKPDGSSVVNVYYNRVVCTVNFETDGGSPIPSQQVLYGAKVQLPDPPSQEGFRFWDWFIIDSHYQKVFNFDETVTSSKTIHAFWVSDIVTYSLHDTVTRLPAGTDGTFGTEGEYVLFGDYPQSAINSDVTLLWDDDEPDLYPIKWKGMWIYFGDDGNLYVEKNPIYGSIYYKIEPICWRIISKDENGNSLLLSEKMLTSCIYNSNYTNGENYYENNYSVSEISSYLNNEFLNTAFTKSAIDLINDTTIIPDCYVYTSQDEEGFANYNYYLGTHYCLEQYSFTTKIFILSFEDYFNLSPTNDFNDYYENSGMFTIMHRDFTAYAQSDYGPPADLYVNIVLSSTVYDEYSKTFCCSVFSRIVLQPSFGPMNTSNGIVPALKVFIE